MDPLVFNITTDSETASSSAMKAHPGDCAAPLDILEWLDKFDEKIETTSYGQVRRGQIPAALLRSTEPKDLSAMPAPSPPKSASPAPERGEWYAVPGGPKLGVRYVPLGSYHVLLAPQQPAVQPLALRFMHMPRPMPQQGGC